MVLPLRFEFEIVPEPRSRRPGNLNAITQGKRVTKGVSTWRLGLIPQIHSCQQSLDKGTAKQFTNSLCHSNGHHISRLAGSIASPGFAPLRPESAHGASIPPWLFRSAGCPGHPKPPRRGGKPKTQNAVNSGGRETEYEWQHRSGVAITTQNRGQACGGGHSARDGAATRAPWGGRIAAGCPHHKPTLPARVRPDNRGPCAP